MKFIISSWDLDLLLDAIEREADRPIKEVRIYGRNLPRLVRCGECRWFDWEMPVCRYPAAARRVQASDYCSFGKPRENDQSCGAMVVGE